MVVTSFRTRVAIPAAVGVAAAAMALGVAPTAYANDSWGAIAVSPDGQSISVVTDKANQYIADMSATMACQQEVPAPESPAPTEESPAPTAAPAERACNVLITFKFPDCGAVVTNGGHYFGDSGATQEEAEQNAMKQSPGSTVLKSACNEAPVEGDDSSATTAPTTATAPATATTTVEPAPGG